MRLCQAQTELHSAHPHQLPNAPIAVKDGECPFSMDDAQGGAWVESACLQALHHVHQIARGKQIESHWVAQRCLKADTGNKLCLLLGDLDAREEGGYPLAQLLWRHRCHRYGLACIDAWSWWQV